MAEKTQTKTKRKLTGIVTSNKMTDTVVVRVEIKKSHPIYKKVIKSHRKFTAHNEIEGVSIGDTVTIEETRPMSATKTWKVINKLA